MTICERPPEISLLIATKDRAALLERTLSTLRHQSSVDVDWEVIVVDNGSIDDTPTVLSKFREHLPLTVLNEPVPGKSRALNRALEVARGGLFVFTDDDVELCTSWLADLYNASLRWTTSSIFGGPIFPSYPPETPFWLQQAPYAGWAFAAFEVSMPEGPLLKGLPIGPNFAVRAIKMLGMRFRTELGPSGKNYPMGCEYELLQRLVKRGESIVYVPSASVKHFVDRKQLNFKWLCRRAFCFGRGTHHIDMAYKEEVRLFLSMPRYKVVRALKASARCVASLFRGKERFYYAGTELFCLLGELYEYRITASRSKKAAGP